MLAPIPPTSRPSDLLSDRPRAECPQKRLCIERLCAIPGCSSRAGRHRPYTCSKGECPAYQRLGAPHSVLTCDCTSLITTQVKLHSGMRPLNSASWFGLPTSPKSEWVTEVRLPGVDLEAVELKVCPPHL